MKNPMNNVNAARCAVLRQRAEQCFARHYAQHRAGTPAYNHDAARSSITPCYALSREALACGSGSVSIWSRDRDR